jgi:hypothetical protein
MKRFLTLVIALLTIGGVSLLAQGVVDPAVAAAPDATILDKMLDGITTFLQSTAFAHLNIGNIVMMIIGVIYVMLAIFKGF